MNVDKIASLCCKFDKLFHVSQCFDEVGSRMFKYEAPNVFYFLI